MEETNKNQANRMHQAKVRPRGSYRDNVLTENSFIYFSALADEFGVCCRTFKKHILKDEHLLKQLQETGFTIEKNHLSGKNLTQHQADLIRTRFKKHE